MNFIFVLSLIDTVSVYINFNGERITGINAGIGGLILYPLIMMVLFLIFGVFLWLGFTLVMKLKKKIKVKLYLNDSN